MHSSCSLLRRSAPITFGLAVSLVAASPEVPVDRLGDLTLEQLMEMRVEKVFSASRYEQNVTHAPASVTLVSADEIARYGHRTLSDVLRSVRGLYVSNDSSSSYLGARGFLRPGDYNTRVLVLVDGHRMNDSVYDAAYFDRENMLDTDLYERVEVVRGPSSSIYGSSALSGVVNVVTKSGAQFEGGSLSAEVGSHGTYKGRATWGRGFKNGADWLVSASHYTSKGRGRIYYPEFDQRLVSHSEARNDGVAENSDAEEALNLFSRARIGSVVVTGFFNRREKQVPTASFSTVFNDGRERLTEYRSYLDAKIDHVLSPDLRLLGRVSYDNYRYFGDYPADHGLAETVMNKDGARGEWVGAELQLHRSWFERVSVTAGGEFRAHLHQDQFNYDLEPYVSNLDHRQDSRTFGLYTQAEVRVTSQVSLNGGLRYDRHYGSFGRTTNPRIGAIFNPRPGTTFKALYGQAFRGPNAYERTYYSDQALAPPLGPEKIRTSELAWQQLLGRHYRVGLSAYRYRVYGLIDQATTPVGELYFQNLERVRAQGAEIELEGKWPGGWFARASYALQHAEDAAGLVLTNSPRHLAKLNAQIPVAGERLAAGIEVQYHGSATTLARRRAPDFLLTHLTLLSRGWRSGWEISGSVYNVFDEQYGYPGAGDHLQDILPQDGRTFRLKVSYSF
jgi:outer membrane receptor for ferrienterochelin and colicins